MKYGEIVRQTAKTATKQDMELLTDMTEDFIEGMRER